MVFIFFKYYNTVYCLLFTVRFVAHTMTAEEIVYVY